MKDKLKDWTKRFSEGCGNTIIGGKPSDCEECLDAFVDAVDRLYRPTPSTDFTEVYKNPYKDYLFFDRHEKQWFVGWYRGEKDKFLWTAHSLDGDEYLDPSHWLPLPNNPLTNSENE